MLIVRKVETAPTRTAVFAEIKANNRVFRVVDGIYRSSGALVFQRLALFLYMLKCVASVSPMPTSPSRSLAVAGYANEMHAIERISSIAPDVDITVLRHARRNMVKPSQLVRTLRMLASLPRCWRVLGKIARGYSFMPACRIASALAYYIRFAQILDANECVDSAVTASNYSPDALGLSAAAHARGLSVIYVNHAPVPRNSRVAPPVLADCSVFNGDSAREMYTRRSHYLSETVLIGQPGAAQPFSWRDEAASIGIFLTALTRVEAIERLISNVRESSPSIQILIRHHPVSLLETDLSTVIARHDGIKVTLGTPLDDDIAACDVIFCGNSGVTLNALRVWASRGVSTGA